MKKKRIQCKQCGKKISNTGNSQGNLEIHYKRTKHNLMPKGRNE